MTNTHRVTIQTFLSYCVYISRKAYLISKSNHSSRFVDCYPFEITLYIQLFPTPICLDALHTVVQNCYEVEKISYTLFNFPYLGPRVPEIIEESNERADMICFAALSDGNF